jgi:hypothetical protein
MNKYIALFNRFEITLPEECASNCSHAGDCGPDVEAWLNDEEVRPELDKLDPQKLREELAEYGSWDDEQLADHEENLARILWIAAGNIREEWDMNLEE